MKRRFTMIAAAVLTAFCLSVPVLAESEEQAAPAEQSASAAEEKTEEKAADVYTTEDGVLSINLPNENWKEIKDPAKWAVISDGTNTITLEHYANGEKLPEPRVADEHYVKVYQATFSTQNEVFIITGLVTEADSIEDVCNAILSAKVNVYDTKTAVIKAAPSTAEYTVRNIGQTWYVVNDSVNVRLGASTETQIIGTLFYGNSVYVKGAVQQNGQDTGWMQIDYNNSTAYVYGDFLSSSAPQQSSQTANVTYTGRVKTIYTDYGSPITIYEATDGKWYDAYGDSYTAILDGQFVGDLGDILTENQPVIGIYPTGNVVTLYWLNGNGCTVEEYSNGMFYSDDWVSYYPTGGGTWMGSDGTILYTSPQELGNYEPYDTVYIESVDTGEIVAIESRGGDYMDDEGTLYSRTQDGDYIDYFGNHYVDVDW